MSSTFLLSLLSHFFLQFIAGLLDLADLGLPWWVIISGTTLLLRSALTVPLAIYQQKVVARIELLKPLISEYAEAIKHNIVVKCRREGQPVEEAERRYVSLHLMDHSL